MAAIMKKTLFLLVYLIISLNTFGQLIMGTVTDKLTGEPLIGALVVIKGTTTGAASGMNGEFSFQANHTLPFVLSCSFVGYSIEERIVTDEASKVNFRMSALKTNLKEITVLDRRLS